MKRHTRVALCTMWAVACMIALLRAWSIVDWFTVLLAALGGTCSAYYVNRLIIILSED